MINSELRELEAAASGCTRCRLAEGRTQVVFGNGNPRADLMLVGEGPGFYEDKQGEPFVGRSGQLLDRMLRGIGLRREEVYVCNVVKCLRYTAPVQLGDGSWERIGRLVRSRYDGLVMAVDADGQLVPRQVTGWYASPLAGRRVYKLSYRSAKNGGKARVGIQLTGDHEVLTEKGFVPVEELSAGALIATGQGLSELAREVVCGTLLGDGYLSGASAHLSFGHSARQEDYARFKADLLGELFPQIKTLNVAAKSRGPASYPVVQVRTLAHRALKILRSDFYRPEKRVPAWMAEQLTPRILAIWFMDDGSTRIRPPRQPSAEIATCGFAEEDLLILVAGLARLGLRATAQRGRLIFDVRETRALSEIIAPYVPPAMRYKLHPEVADRHAFDPDRLRPGRQEVLYDEAVVEDITDRPRTDTTFFCIDVEETHNFVTAGGVVHNCRPPGNRDPQPDEIAACHGYLDEQVRLVDPKVVVALGNFAAKTLLDTTTGITRLRGRTYPFQGRTLLPTFHPAAALRATGRPGDDAMTGLEDDFRTVAGLLERLEPPAPLPPTSVPVPHAEVTDPAPAPVVEAEAEPEQLGLF